MNCDLYRHFNKEGHLLYVGISLSTFHRLSQHKNHSHWFNEITSVTIEKFKSRKEAIEAEKEAITNEDPSHNLYRPIVKEIENHKRQNLRETSREDLTERIVKFNPIYSLEEAANVLRMSSYTVKALIKDGKLSCVESGSHVATLRNGKRAKVIRCKITGWQLIDFIETWEHINATKY